MSALIRWQTWSKWSHAAFMLADGRVVEAWGQPFPFGKVDVLPGLKRGIEGVEFFDLYPALSEPQERQLQKNLLELAAVRTPYDYLGVLRFLPRWKSESNRSRFCSELVLGELRKVGYSLLKRIEPEETSPHHIGISPCLVRCQPPAQYLITGDLPVYPPDEDGILP